MCDARGPRFWERYEGPKYRFKVVVSNTHEFHPNPVTASLAVTLNLYFQNLITYGDMDVESRRTVRPSVVHHHCEQLAAMV